MNVLVCQTFAVLRQVKTMGWRRLLEVGVGRRGKIWVDENGAATRGRERSARCDISVLYK
jgi:hypothetical protein